VRMDEIGLRVVEDLAGRVSGPMKLRLLVRPVMASLFAVLSGLRDARAGDPDPACFWGLMSDPAARVDRTEDGWKSVGKVFVLALPLDVVCQIFELGFVYQWELLRESADFSLTADSTG
jgi:hypothetical protein